MLNKKSSFLFNFDIIGPNPKLYIFNKERYQSIFSLVLSLLIILITISFVLYSLINYIKNDRPTVVYSKSNDENEERKIFLNDTLLMFQFIDFSNLKKINDSVISFEGEYSAIYYNATSKLIKLNVTNCHLGVNLNSKYENFFKEKLSSLTLDYNKTDKNIEDFYCINGDNNDINIFYYPNVGSSNINLNIVIKNQKLYSPEDISIMMIYENNLLNHDNKESPITEGIAYQFIQGFSSNEETIINFNFQYLKYETDDGLFLNSLKYLNGMSFLDMTYFKSKNDNYDINKDFNKYNSSKIGSLSISFNKSNYDYYRRTYKKLQALLAEIMSIVNLLFEIGRQILSFLNEKKMSVDIIGNLFNVEENGKKNKRYINCNDRIKIAPEKINNSFKLTEKNNMNLETAESIREDIENKNEKVLKHIHFYHVIKSFLCNSNKEKLISLCHDIIVQDMCVETILERFYNLLRIYSSILDIEKNNLGLNKEPRFRKVKTIINDIINQNTKEFKT